MIFSAILAFFLLIINIILGILPTAELPSFFTSFFSAVQPYYNQLNTYIPMSTIGTALSLIVGLEVAIALVKLVLLAYRMVRG